VAARVLDALVPAAVALALILGARGASAQTTFRVCMDTALPPWSFIPARLPRFDEDPATAKRLPPASAAEVKTAQGLDVDVAQALAKRLGQDLQIVHTSWYEIEKALLAGSCDAIVNAWTPSRRTPASIAASEPYFVWGLQVAVRKDETRFKTYQDLAGRAVGHIDDPALELTLRALAGARLQPFALNRELFYALQAGKVDAVAHDSTYIAWRIGRGEPFRTLGPPLNKLGYHVAVAKAGGETATRVLAAVKNLMGDAEMGAIRTKWRREQE
jgi:polar amino acid transport system substrate-binding protein